MQSTKILITCDGRLVNGYCDKCAQPAQTTSSYCLRLLEASPSKEVSVEQTATAEVPWELKIIKQIWRRAYLDSEEDHVKILKEYGEFYAQSERQRAEKTFGIINDILKSLQEAQPADLYLLVREVDIDLPLIQAKIKDELIRLKR